jgi:PAS domain S-box-containing protein
LRAAQDAIISTDVAFNVRSWNPAAERVFGWRDHEVIGRSVIEVLNTEMTEEQRLALRSLLLDGKPFVGELRMHTKDGSPVEIESSSVALRDADCRAIGVVAVMREVGERKRLEQALKEHTAQLEERSRQLEETNQELDGFTYSVSHDLRAPLRAVDGFSRILLDDYSDRLDDEGRRVLDVICKNTQKMGQLIDDLLAFSRMARKFMQPESVDMAALVKSAIEEVSPGTSGRTVDFRVGPLPPASGDSAMLKQVWLNLIGNSVKYTRKRERAVVEVACATENGELIYSVKDNGVGFDTQYLHKLFGVFQRLHAAKEFEGTGVGLALVQRIVHRHRGRVWAEGRVDEGATFWFALPRKEGSDAT